MKVLRGLLFLLLVVFATALALVLVHRFNPEPLDESPAPAGTTGAQLVERGAYLARAGNCIACHTARGGAAYAGGRGIETPFGTLYAGNLTPDRDTGLGDWSAAEFWRAMHHGRSKDGRLLYPAFPYPNYTNVTREDSDAIHAFLRSLPAVRQATPAHQLRFPYDSQLALAAWRVLFFRPASFESDPARTAEWNRGAYLVRGLGHCNACHAARNVFGATSESLELSGGLIPMQNWYAPSLNAADEAGVAGWDSADVVALMKTGVSRHGSAMGPMAEVVYRSTQHLSDADLRAVAVFLKELPQARPEQRESVAADPGVLTRGGKIYETRCAECHGASGQGAGKAYPALAGNRAVTMRTPANLIQVLLNGGFAPSTAANPRPWGMPPFVHALDEAEIASVLTYIRQSWGHQAAPVSQLDVLQFREGRGQP
ncbi:cytochrome c [Aquabacterium sp. A7-Y]|uniref:c-type cytochrome n=1 Tax=Aquabacterium sp. A7-Y TaxID=1349605 RepID=UPI00223C9863|nr:cytochrome c [Aquabacterium sp. A7-Y]MCW7540822.1 cytochrome c [Aquabacterium sp. A7-Y]